MNHCRKSPQLRIQNPAYGRAFERLDAALEENTQSDNSRLIRLMREAYLKEQEESRKSGTIIIPK
jgi:hypothetical protein